MNPQDPLANLHPLREPAAVGLWPPAPGWWLLAGALLAALAAGVIWLYRRRLANAYRRRALRQLDQLHARLAQDNDTLGYAEAVNALLKSAALSAFPEREVAALHGQRWLSFLESTAPGTRFESDFTAAIYSGEAQWLDTEQLHGDARRWLLRHRGTP